MMKKTMISAVFAITVMIVAIFATHQNAMAGSDYSARDFVFSNYPNPELQSDGRYMVERFLGECSRFIEPNWGKYKAKAAIYMTSPNVVATSIMISQDRVSHFWTIGKIRGKTGLRIEAGDDASYQICPSRDVP